MARSSCVSFGYLLTHGHGASPAVVGAKMSSAWADNWRTDDTGCLCIQNSTQGLQGSWGKCTIQVLDALQNFLLSISQDTAFGIGDGWLLGHGMGGGRQWLLKTFPMGQGDIV